MSRAGSVLFYVQHLLGVGHLKRVAVLSRRLAAHGFDVTVISGGMPVDSIRFGRAAVVQLPPLRAADTSFSGLVDQDGAPASDAVFAARRIRLAETVREARPDIVITEHFPFGRRQLAEEILALIETACARHPRPWIVASVRDILVAPQKPERCVELANAHYDDVLVHGDPGIVPFAASFSLADRIVSKIHYTGYVVEDGPPPIPDGARREILVSTGSGADAARLIKTALAARPLSSARDNPWRVLTGLLGGESESAAFQTLAGADITVQAFRPDMLSLLTRCRLSISRAGYNTLAETVAAGARSIVVPFETARETEQALRAARFSAAGLCTMIRQADLTPEGLAEAIDAALAMPPPDRTVLRLDGAGATAHFLADGIDRLMVRRA